MSDANATPIRDTMKFRADMVNYGLELLLGQFRGVGRGENLTALLAPLLEVSQEAEDAFFDLFTDRTLINAQGIHLDNIGRLVGERRGDLDDDDFRRFIRVRVLQNVAQGDIGSIIEVINTMSGATKTRYIPQYPAHYLLEVTTLQPLAANIVARIQEVMPRITSAGVGFNITEVEEEESFAFAGGGTEGLGFGLGKFARIIL